MPGHAIEHGTLEPGYHNRHKIIHEGHTACVFKRYKRTLFPLNAQVAALQKIRAASERGSQLLTICKHDELERVATEGSAEARDRYEISWRKYRQARICSRFQEHCVVYGCVVVDEHVVRALIKHSGCTHRCHVVHVHIAVKGGDHLPACSHRQTGCQRRD